MICPAGLVLISMYRTSTFDFLLFFNLVRHRVFVSRRYCVLRIAGFSHAQSRPSAQCLTPCGKHRVYGQTVFPCRGKKRLVVVCRQRGGQVGLHQRTLAATLAPAPDL